MKKILLISFLLPALNGLTQSISINYTEKDQKKFSEMINAEGLKKDLSILAGPEMEGRETGMPGQKKAAAYIEARMKNMGLLPVPALKGAYQQYYYLAKNRQKDSIWASNVVGMIEGSEFKDEYVFITAHYDHLGVYKNNIYYGADDDGSGTAAVLQIASIFAQAKAEGKGPKRSMVFMTFSGEEKGLLGSEFYSENPLLPLEKTSADLNIDMIGRIDTERKQADTNHYVYVIGHDKISTELGAVCEKSNAGSSHISLDYKFDDPNDPNRIYFRSDHYNFARKGVPILFFYDGMLLGDYHKPTDTVDKINWDVYVKRARMIFSTAWQVANSDHLMKRDLPIPTMTR